MKPSTGVIHPCNDSYMNTTTATSQYRTIAVEITAKGTVYTTSGVLLGDVDGMTRLGWEFSA